MEDNKILNEAEGINADYSALNDETIPTSPSDKAWNDLFKKYLNPNNVKYYLITVDGFSRKTPIQGEPSKGYLKFTGKTEEKEGRKKFFIFGRRNLEDIVKDEDIKIVADENDATVFKNDDIEPIINAIKRNPNFRLRSTRFGKKDVSSQLLNEINYANQIMQLYFSKLVDNDKAGDMLRNALSMLNSICRQRNNPLVGNPLFDVLAAIVKVNPTFDINSYSIVTLNNLIADRILNVKDIINPSNILDALAYNNNLYKYRETQIKSIFNWYEQARNIPGRISIPQLLELGNDQREIKKQFAKNLILKINDEDLLKAIANGVKLGEDEHLTRIGYKPDDTVIQRSFVRNPDECEDIYNKILSTTSRKEDDSAKTVVTLRVGDVTYTGENSSWYNEDDENKLIIRFKSVDFTKTSFISLFVGEKKDVNLLDDLIKSDYFKDSNYLSTDSGNLIVTQDIKCPVVVELDADNNYKATKMELKTKDSGKEETKPENTNVEDNTNTENTETTSDETQNTETNNTQEITFGNKTIGEIASMNKDEFRDFKASLTPEEKSRLKSIGGRLLS